MMKDSHHDSDNIQHHFGPFLTWVAERRLQRRTLLYTSRRPRNLGYVAVAAQLIGMLLFNVNSAWSIWRRRRSKMSVVSYEMNMQKGLP